MLHYVIYLPFLSVCLSVTASLINNIVRRPAVNRERHRDGPIVKPCSSGMQADVNPSSFRGREGSSSVANLRFRPSTMPTSVDTSVSTAQLPVQPWSFRLHFPSSALPSTGRTGRGGRSRPRRNRNSSRRRKL